MTTLSALLYTTYGFIMAIIALLIVNRRNKNYEISNTHIRILNDLLKEKNTLKALLDKYQEKLTLLNQKLELNKAIDNHITNTKPLKVKLDKKVKTK